jgi:hypothetical protein
MVWRPDCEVSVELANESMRLSVMLLHLELVQPPAPGTGAATGTWNCAATGQGR